MSELAETSLSPVSALRSLSLSNANASANASAVDDFDDDNGNVNEDAIDFANNNEVRIRPP